MNNQEYHRLLDLATKAIYSAEPLLKVDTGKRQQDFYFNLPEPQRSGTATQQISYAKQAAKNFLANHGITEPTIF